MQSLPETLFLLIIQKFSINSSKHFGHTKFDAFPSSQPPEKCGIAPSGTRGNRTALFCQLRSYRYLYCRLLSVCSVQCWQDTSFKLAWEFKGVYFSQLTPHSVFETILPTSKKSRGDMIMKKNKFKAPDANVMLSDGSEKRLRDLWQGQTLVLVFLRHFG